MENALEKYCMEMMNTYGGAYTIHYELGVIAVYKRGIQELDGSQPTPHKRVYLIE